MGSRTERVRARDGGERLVRRWSAAGPPWLHLLLLHGVGEHSGRYEAVGSQLAETGIEVHAIDHHGFGGSDGPRGDVPRWSVFHDDVEDRLGVVRVGAAGCRIALYGHSLGGLMALGYVLTGRPLPDLLVLSSPALADALPAWKHVVARILRPIAPGLAVATDIAPEVLSRDPEVAARDAQDPLIVGRATVRLGGEGFVEQSRVLGSLDRLTVPTYVFHGSDDRLVPVSASAPLEGRPGVTRVVLPGLRHETHNEPEGGAVVDGVIGWLRDRVGTPSADGDDHGATIARQPNTPPGSASSAESVVSPQTRGT